MRWWLVSLYCVFLCQAEDGIRNAHWSLEFRRVLFRSYFAKVLGQNRYDTSFYLLGWTPSSFDANHTIAAVMACRGEGTGAFNLGGYCNRRVTELSGLIQVETDPERRQALIDEANRVHSEEIGHIPLHQQIGRAHV